MDFDNLSPEDIKSLASMLSTQDETGDLSKDSDYQRKMIDALRNNAPQGQMVGGHFVAPSVTQHLANFGGQLLANRQMKMDDSKIAANRGLLNQGRASWMQALAGMMRKPQQPIIGDDPNAGLAPSAAGPDNLPY